MIVNFFIFAKEVTLQPPTGRLALALGLMCHMTVSLGACDHKGPFHS